MINHKIWPGHDIQGSVRGGANRIYLSSSLVGLSSEQRVYKSIILRASSKVTNDPPCSLTLPLAFTCVNVLDLQSSLVLLFVVKDAALRREIITITIINKTYIAISMYQPFF